MLMCFSQPVSDKSSSILNGLSTAAQPARSKISCRGESHMGDVLGGTCSGSSQGSLYRGTAGILVSFSLPFKRRQANSNLLAGASFLCLPVHGFQRIGIVDQFDPAINMRLALSL